MRINKPLVSTIVVVIGIVSGCNKHSDEVNAETVRFYEHSDSLKQAQHTDASPSLIGRNASPTPGAVDPDADVDTTHVVEAAGKLRESIAQATTANDLSSWRASVEALPFRSLPKEQRYELTKTLRVALQKKNDELYALTLTLPEGKARFDLEAEVARMMEFEGSL